MQSTATYFRRAVSTSSEVLNFFQKLHVLFCEIKFIMKYGYTQAKKYNAIVPLFFPDNIKSGMQQQ
jgi:hypothetical protein